MDYFSSVTLGLVQGVTEFLPISSTGHLILAREALGINTGSGLSVDAVLQLATALAVLIYFRRDYLRLLGTFGRTVLRKPVEVRESTLLWALLLGTLPAVVFGLLLEKKMETVFRSGTLVALSLLAGSLLFYVAERLGKQNVALTLRKGIAIGFYQCLALVPGVSRSGATISGGLLLGLTREDAARFGFLLSFPITFGSGLLKLYELIKGGFTATFGPELLIGFLVSFLSGMLVIHWLLRYLRTHSLSVFIWYRVALAAVVLAIAYL